jgi:hypothetical protein
MSGQPSKLSEVSLVARNFGDGLVFEDVLNDWFEFLGGKPGEVVIVDGGSNAETQAVYWQLFQKGLIDKLQIIKPDHEDNNHTRGYVQIYTAGSIASKPYLLWFNIDTLPYRQGHENWLDESIGYLDRDDVFAIGGSFNLPSKHHDAWPGWYFSQKCSLNFTLLKRSTFMTAMHEYAGDYIAAGFQGENPAAEPNSDRGRYLLEVALEEYIQRHHVYTLCKVEDPNWTVFHTNTHEERLQKIREKYLDRQDITRYMNIGFSDEKPDPAKALYYGQPPVKVSLVKQLRVLFGQSPAGEQWRQLKQKLNH